VLSLLRVAGLGIRLGIIASDLHHASGSTHSIGHTTDAQGRLERFIAPLAGTGVGRQSMRHADVALREPRSTFCGLCVDSIATLDQSGNLVDRRHAQANGAHP
jgi:hypothetical protein